MERQAKDGTVYKQVGSDEWTPVTRTAKDGTVFKKVGADDWTPLEAQSSAQPSEDQPGAILGAVVKFSKAVDSVTGAPTRAAIGAIQDGNNPVGAFASQFARDPDKAPTGKQIAEKAGVSNQTKVIRTAEEQVKFDRIHNPGWAASMKQMKKETQPVTIVPSEAIGNAIDIAADWTNAIPVVGQAKKFASGTKLGSQAAEKAAQVASKAGESVKGLTKEAGKRAISVLLGPDVHSINRYLDRADSVRNAKSVEEIKNSIDSTMQGIFEGVEQAKLTKEEAKEAVKAVESKVRDTVRDANFQFRIDQADLKDSFKVAQSKLDEAYKGETAKLQSVKSPVELKNDIPDSIQQLKERIRQGSAESYQILDQDPKAYGVRSAGKLLRQMADDMNIKAFDKSAPDAPAGLVSQAQWGTAKASPSLPVTSQSIGVQNELRKFAKLLEQTPERVPARELKKILQQIDASEMATYGQPGFDSRVSQAYKEVRATIDKVIKNENPAYKAKMADVAKDMSLMDRAIARFGDDRATASKLNAIGNRTAEADRLLLQEIGESTGKDFRTPVESFQKSQATLKDPRALESIKTRLPEFSQARLQELKLRQSQRPEAAKKFVESALEREGLPTAKARATESLTAAEQKLLDAQTKLEPVKRLTPENTQGKINALIKAPGKENIEIRRSLEELSKMSEKDFVNWIADRRAADQFAGEFRAGSRNIGIWGILGTLIGGPVGTGVGVGMGAVVDRFGPKMAQKVLDAALKVKGNPTKAKILALKLDPRIEHYLVRELGRGEMMTRESRQVSEKDRKKGPEKWANDGFEKLLKHSDQPEALNLNKEELLKDPKIKELLIRASDLKPGTPAMNNIMSQIKNRQAKGQE